MTRTEIIKNNECIAYFGDSPKEMLSLGGFIKDKQILKREMIERSGCRYTTLYIQG